MNCVVEDQSWEKSSTKATDRAPKVIIALENISKPFNKNGMQIKHNAHLVLEGIQGETVGKDLEEAGGHSAWQIYSHHQVSQEGV